MNLNESTFWVVQVPGFHTAQGNPCSVVLVNECAGTGEEVLAFQMTHCRSYSSCHPSVRASGQYIR